MGGFSFASYISICDNLQLQVYGQDVSLTIHFPPGSGIPDTTVAAITIRPPISEETAPGSTAGTGVLYMWTRQDQLPGLVLGCTASVNGVDYDLSLLETDRESGCVLKMHRRRLPWNA